MRNGCIDLGGVDAAFNVAGISGRRFGDGPAHECTDDGWAITLDTNARGIFYCCRAILRRMLDQPVGADGLRGSILNMASVLGFSPEPRHFGTHAYAASKGAIIAMTRAMAATYAPQRIRVNVIAPGLVRTPMTERWLNDPEISDRVLADSPIRRAAEPEEIADLVMFLASDQAGVITGAVYPIDGARTTHWLPRAGSTATGFLELGITKSCGYFTCQAGRRPSSNCPSRDVKE